MKIKVLRGIGAASLAILLLGGSSLAASPSQSSSIGLEARIVQGEVYVKASALTQQLGGSGTFDSKTGTYTYVPSAGAPEIVEQVSPSVVAIIGKAASSRTSDRYALSHGTGVVWKKDGWIVTNAHVVKGMRDLTVVTFDGKQYAGTVKSMDETSDLALVKINAANLKAATFLKDITRLKAGETVVAIGTPVSFALRNSATSGVLSGMNRSIASAYQLLQTDAAINPGNSGGPLVNMRGEVIGINTLKFAHADIDNIGFSIPSDTVLHIVGHLEKYGAVKRASLGLELEESWAAIVGLPTNDPLTILDVRSAEARKLGIEKGDVLYSVAGKQISSLVELNEQLKSYLPGQTVEVTLLSDGDLVTRKLKLIAHS